MSRRAGVFVTRRPRLVLLGAPAFLLLSVVFGAEATGRLKTRGYDDPRSESSRAAHGSVDGPAARSAGEVAHVDGEGEELGAPPRSPS